jgi:hypothetical protein
VREMSETEDGEKKVKRLEYVKLAIQIWIAVDGTLIAIALLKLALYGIFSRAR